MGEGVKAVQVIGLRAVQVIGLKAVQVRASRQYR